MESHHCFCYILQSLPRISPRNLEPHGLTTLRHYSMKLSEPLAAVQTPRIPFSDPRRMERIEVVLERWNTVGITDLVPASIEEYIAIMRLHQRVLQLVVKDTSLTTST